MLLVRAVGRRGAQPDRAGMGWRSSSRICGMAHPAVLVVGGGKAKCFQRGNRSSRLVLANSII